MADNQQNVQEIKKSLERVAALMKNDPDQARKLLQETTQKLDQMGSGQQQGQQPQTQQAPDQPQG